MMTDDPGLGRFCSRHDELIGKAVSRRIGRPKCSRTSESEH